MLHKYALFFVLLVLSLQARNLLTNPGFEEGIPRPGLSRILPGWEVRSVDQVQSFHSLDESNPYAGKKSAKITFPTDETGRTGYFTPDRLIKIQCGRNYRLTFHARFQPGATHTKAAAVLTRFGADRKMAGMGGIKEVQITDSETWQKYEMDYFVPGSESEENFFRLNLRLHGPGSVWFDEIVLEGTSTPRMIVEFYPSSVNQGKSLYPIRNEINHLLVYPFYAGARQNLELHLDVPLEFPLLEAASVFAGSVPNPVVEETRAEERIYYRLKLVPATVLPVKSLARDLFSGTGLLFHASASLPPGALNWSMREDGEILQSGVLQIKPLDDPGYSLPENFSLFTWYAPFANYLSSLENKADWIRTMQKSAVRAGGVSAGGDSQNADFFNNLSFRAWRSFWYEVPGNCLTGMLSGTSFAAAIKNRLRGLQGLNQPVLNWNYEPNLPEYYHLCPDCRKAFEEFAGVSTQGLPDAKGIEAKFPDEYLAFRSSQQLEIISRYSQWCREAGVQGMVCSYTVNRNMSDSAMRNLQRRLGNLKDYRKILDNYLPQVYFAPENLWDNLAAVREYYPDCIPVYTSDERHNQNTYPYSLLTPETVKMEILMSAAQACRTIGLFVGFHTFDGRQIIALREALDIIARFEKFYYLGTEASALVKTLAQPDKIRFSVFQYEGQYLLSVFNPDRYQKQSVELALEFPWSKFQLQAPHEKKRLLLPDGTELLEKGQTITLELPLGGSRFILISEKGIAGAEDWPVERLPASAAAVLETKTLLQEGAWFCQSIGKSGEAPEKIKLHWKDKTVTVELADNAVITSDELPLPVLYHHRGSGGLFRDLFWEPKGARWSPDSQLPCKLLKVHVQNDEFQIHTEQDLKHVLLQGMQLRKTYHFKPGFQEIRADIEIANQQAGSVEFAYWVHHRPALQRESLLLQAVGEEAVQVQSHPGENLFIPVTSSQWLKVNDQYFFAWINSHLEKFYSWTGAEFPSIEMIGEKNRLEAGQSYRCQLIVRAITERFSAEVPQSGFQLSSPYQKRFSKEFRASLHNHAQHAPSYTHAPVPPPQRLTDYRDYPSDPPYGFVVISEHNRITLPVNCTPKGQEPQWGVEGILFVPGNERSIGSYRSGSYCGTFFGEINCVGVSTEATDPADPKSYRHNSWNVLKPDLTIQDLVTDGVFVSLCHPNAKLEINGIHRWSSSGYTYDELDLIFGNPEKGLLPFPVFPHALEIGNQGYDFTDRTNYTNAEDKWDYLLSRGIRLFGTASDDSHHQAPFAGWVVVYVDEVTQDAFLYSLRQGHFYASQGPKFTEIRQNGTTITLKTDQPASIEFIGRNGKILKQVDNALESNYTATGTELYIRGRITRDCPEVREIKGRNIGRRRSAWSNPFYITGK